MGEKASNYLLYFSSEQLPGCNFDSVDRISNLRYGIVCPYIDSIPGATRWGNKRSARTAATRSGH